MAIAFEKCDYFVEHLAEGEINFQADTLMVAFSSSDNPVTSDDGHIADVTCVSSSNMDSVTVVMSSSAQTDGTYKLCITDKVITSSGGASPTFEYVILYDDTSSDDCIIGSYDYGSGLTLGLNETLTLNFDDANGVLTIA